MIGVALDHIRRELRDHLGVTDGEVRIDSGQSMGQAGPQGATITLVHVEEEAALRNTPHVVETAGRPSYREPSVFLNLYLLFSFDFIDYGTSLENLSRTAAMFQDRRYLSATNVSAGLTWPAGLERLIFEHHNMSFEALNNLWSVMGGSHYPSVIYKVRLVEIRTERPPVAADAIETIAFESVVR